MKTVRLFATLRDIAGVKELQIPFCDGESVRDLIADVSQVSPALGATILDANGELTGVVNILVHGRNIQWLQGLDTVIHADDQLILLPPSAGG